jgi:hypothetical protein
VYVRKHTAHTGEVALRKICGEGVASGGVYFGSEDVVGRIVELDCFVIEIGIVTRFVIYLGVRRVEMG